MGGECGVVASPMFRVEHQGKIEELCLQMGILSVLPQKMQQIFRRRQCRIGAVDHKAFVEMEMAVRLVPIYGKRRKHGGKLQTLAQHVRHSGIVRIVVVGIEGKDTARENVHHILAGRLHDHITDEGGRQAPTFREQLPEPRQLHGVWQLGEQQQIERLLKSKPVVREKSVDQRAHVDTAVIELPLARKLFPVRTALFRLDPGDLRQSRDHAVAVEIAQTAVHVMLSIHFRDNVVVLAGFLRKLLYIGIRFCKGFRHAPISFSMEYGL